jgi:hypothetical protein
MISTKHNHQLWQDSFMLKHTAGQLRVAVGVSACMHLKRVAYMRVVGWLCFLLLCFLARL